MEHRHDAEAGRGRGDLVIDEELARLVAAIELVAESTVSRVTLTGLHFGEALIPRTAALAARRGLRIRPLWPMGDGPVDLVVEGLDA